MKIEYEKLWQYGLHLCLPLFSLAFVSSCPSVDPLVSAFHTYFFLLTSRDASLLSHHPKHQLSTCRAIRRFQRLSSHIFSSYVLLSGSFQTFLVFPNICCDTLSPWVILYGSKFIYIPTLWFYNADCDRSEWFYKFWYVLCKQWHQV